METDEHTKPEQREPVVKVVETEDTAAVASVTERTKDNSSTIISTMPMVTTGKEGDQPVLDMHLASGITQGDLMKIENERHGMQIITASAVPTAAITHADIPIISLSDGEDTCVTSLQKVGKKRSSVGGSGGEEEQRFRLKRRKIKVAGAPKMPLTGYVRYMNDRRETLRKELPTKTAIEHTKIIGEEWHQLPDERKAPYMKAAELDKQRYLDELHTFLKARPDVLACELAKNKVRKTHGDPGKSVLKEKSQSISNIKNAKDLNNAKEKARSNSDKDITPPPMDKPKRKRLPLQTKYIETVNEITDTNAITTASVAPALGSVTTVVPVITPAATINTPVPGEIPIFTNEFLEHNKTFDMELRTLRKSKADLEQQNAVLEKHVENMKFGVEKLASENDELQEKNRLLEIYLEKLKHKLANALAGLSIPSEPNGATIENIDKYMNDLYKMATTNTHGPASLNKAKDIIRKLDLQIQL